MAEPVYAGDGSLSGYTAKLRYTVYLDDEIYDAESNEEGLFATNAERCADVRRGTDARL